MILFTGAGGNYGLTVPYNGALLGGWLQYEVTENNATTLNYWKCVIDGLEIGLQQKNMQWIHLSLIWGMVTTNSQNNLVLQLLLNGLELVQCEKNVQLARQSHQIWIDTAIKKAQELFYETRTDKQSSLLISSRKLNSTERLTFSIALLVLQPRYLTTTNMMSLIGMEYFELLELRHSTFYWQINGLLRDLTPNRIQSVNSNHGRDQYDNLMGALCTEGNELSYIMLNGDTIDENGDITNLYDSCLYDPSLCKSFALSFRLKLLELPKKLGQVQEILRTTPIDAGKKTVGLFMHLSTDLSEFIVEIRSQFLTSKNSIKIKLVQQPGKWINVQIFYYQDRPITIRVDGNLIASIENGTVMSDINVKLSSQVRVKQKVLIGRGLKLCLSSMTLYDISSENDSSSLINTPSSKICYENMDMFESLKGLMNDYNNRENSASRLEGFNTSLSMPLLTCFQNPDLCNTNGMVMSMWIMISGFINGNGKNFTLKTNENATAIILSTGPPEKPGILLQVIGQVHNGQLEISLQTSVYTEQFLWSVKSPKAVQLGRWTNIAFSWYSIPEDESGSLDVYIDGIRKHSSTMPNSLLTMR
ncbi:unnamed protein product [Heterobilharzia americana]|nr:unnamed protein product [Heterobilharzia americana]